MKAACAAEAQDLMDQIADAVEKGRIEKQKANAANQHTEPLGKKLPQPSPSKDANKTATKLAESFGTNRTYVNQARKIKEAAPEIAEAVEDRRRENQAETLRQTHAAKRMNSGQLACLAAETRVESVSGKNLPQTENRDDRKTATKLAESFGTNRTYVNQARKIKEAAPEIAASRHRHHENPILPMAARITHTAPTRPLLLLLALAPIQALKMRSRPAHGL